MAFGNAHLDTDGCTWLEINKKMQVHWPWHSEMLTGTRVNAPVQKAIKKMQVCRPWHLGMLTWTQINAPVQNEIKKCWSLSHDILDDFTVFYTSFGSYTTALSSRNQALVNTQVFTN